ncbi:ABC-type sugar transport system, permease [Hyperthermus butylicus DSM 5456]|uniref:ABC-type sugar transport system, permease n=2 Tax=Hyperthermus butylicus TaxID=54248 RepID=A2BJM1_HYPBU|nr:sugar ABC transporter permease [Hyperthermus butylicus]ABM80182.1 ABC-type sugar transport system, permease [Hyperthermus butylicus DSM 5456]
MQRSHSVFYMRYRLLAEKLDRILPYLLIAPTVVYMGFFVGYPLVQGVKLAFFDEQGRFTTENVDYLLNSPLSKFRDALFYTLLITGIVIPVEFVLALLLAFFFNSFRFRGKNAAIYVTILPLTISDVAAGLIWYSMLTGNGFANKLLLNLGVISEPIQFFGWQNRDMELLAIIITEVWRSTAIVFVILLAGLQMISHEYLEAAEVFGANALQRLRYIVLPMLMPSIQAALIIRTLFALQVFGSVWVLAGRDIPVLAGEAFYEHTQMHHTGVAALYALIIAAISLSLGALYIRFFKARYLEAGR